MWANSPGLLGPQELAIAAMGDAHTLSPSSLMLPTSASKPVQPTFWDASMPVQPSIAMMAHAQKMAPHAQQSLPAGGSGGSAHGHGDASLEAAASWLHEDGLLPELQHGSKAPAGQCLLTAVVSEACWTALCMHGLLVVRVDFTFMSLQADCLLACCIVYYAVIIIWA